MTSLSLPDQGLKFIITRTPSSWGNEIAIPIGTLLTCSNDSNNGRFLGCSTQNTDLKVWVDKDHVRELDEIEYDLLSAIDKPEKRLQVCNDAEWLYEGKTLRPGSHVAVNGSRFQSGVQGMIRYKGDLRDMPGLHFGIELYPQFKGQGSSNGTFREKKYFTTENDLAMFVALHRIRDMDSDAGARSIAPDAEYIKDLPVMVGDRVVLIDDEFDQAEAGVVRWLGFLPDDDNVCVMEKKINAGVEFDKAIGKGSGLYKRQRLFRAQANHALLVPVLGLIKESEYLNMPSQPQY